ncbi:COG4341 Predicted HD phosphohydrolase [Rhabdaerophilaceae bacterium]
MDFRNALIDIYTNKATDRYGLSEVNQLQHALQSAALAEAGSEPAWFITAALLHDVGHMVHELGEDAADHGIDDTHEELAANWLMHHFGPEVSEPVRLHVPAKRYLCATEASYFGKLSDDSVKSLALQGGPMSSDEVLAFEKHPHYEAAVRLRRIDDLAKDPKASTPSFMHFMRYIDEALAVSAAS